MSNLYELSEEIHLEKNIKHNIEIVIDRLKVRGWDPEPSDRLSWRRRLTLADGLAMVDVNGEETDQFQPELRVPGLRHQY